MSSFADYLINLQKNVKIYSLSGENKVSKLNRLTHFQIKHFGLGAIDSSSATNNLLSSIVRFAKKISQFIYPDRYIFGSFLILKKLKNELKQNDVLFISVPWFSAMFILFFKFSMPKNLQVIVDYRDLWINNKLFSGGLVSNLISKKLERYLLKKTNLVLATTKPALNYFKSLDKQCVLVKNGITKEEANTAKQFAYRTIKVSKPTIGYFGALGGKRNIVSLLQTILKKNLDLVVYGHLDMKHKFVCGNSYKGLVDRNIALNKSSKCDVLLISISKEENSLFAIPSKVYEAILLKRFILLYCPKEALILEYLKEIDYPHYHIESAEEFSLEAFMKTLQSIELKKFMDQKEFEVPIRENEFDKLKEYLK